MNPMNDCINCGHFWLASDPQCPEGPKEQRCFSQEDFDVKCSEARSTKGKCGPNGVNFYQALPDGNTHPQPTITP